jgi:hypothetical protein
MREGMELGSKRSEQRRVGRGEGRRGAGAPGLCDGDARGL